MVALGCRSERRARDHRHCGKRRRARQRRRRRAGHGPRGRYGGSRHGRRRRRRRDETRRRGRGRRRLRHRWRRRGRADRHRLYRRGHAVLGLRGRQDPDGMDGLSQRVQWLSPRRQHETAPGDVLASTPRTSKAATRRTRGAPRRRSASPCPPTSGPCCGDASSSTRRRTVLCPMLASSMLASPAPGRLTTLRSTPSIGTRWRRTRRRT